MEIMVMKQSLLNTLNEQVNREFYSAYLYRSAASFMASENFPGISDWMMAQSEEETEHAEKIVKFIEDRGSRVSFLAIDAPEADFNSPLDAFETSFKHEKFITGEINKLFAQSVKEKDYAAQVLLQWFVEEQVEEEAAVGLLVEKFRRAGDNSAALLMLDSEVGTRKN
ncbi:MAG: ferritin [Alphaproteobacteria bacterium]|nr:ferritin [Alphaproteobacteria bacterium]|tara:strand:- start:41 stop:544 length:504 start_codon:yes stop_codon:yes gene_type:complete